MKRPALAFAVVLAVLPLHASARDSLCGPLRAFVASVKPEESRSVVFRTMWGGPFKDEAKEHPIAFLSKRCEHTDYAPAQAVCASLMTDGAVEFADNNFKEALQCLSRKTRLAGGLTFNNAAISLEYRTGERVAFVDLEFAEDPEIGGMFLKVTASGY